MVEAGRKWKVTETDRGAGMTCPREQCGGKLVMNFGKLTKTRNRFNSHCMICPYCECVSLLPKDVTK